tara:strand:+ start:23 stop:1201 length:1179 start_codon:yes stop_codon:yes gene_type:complete
MEEIAQTPNGDIQLGTSNKTATFTIARNGDLIHKMYFQIDMHELMYSPTHNIKNGNFGNRLIKEVECEIGGQKIDKHYNHWLIAWSDLTELNDRGVKAEHYSIKDGIDANLQSNIGDSYKWGEAGGDLAAGGIGRTKFSRTAASYGCGTSDVSKTGNKNHDYTAHIPLQFWFNRNPGLALPLIALQYHEVKIRTVFENITNFDLTVTDFSPKIELYTQYIYLDTDERRRFAQVSHEYLIEQLQYQHEASTSNITLNFNHPVKELIWAGILDEDEATTTHNYKDIPHDSEWKLTLNGHDRFAPRPITYFSRQQIYDYHTGYGDTEDKHNGLAVYSFALKPEEHQPSGTCNFSRIDSAQLIIQTNTAIPDLNIYGVNYNVLRIMSGMGGLAYSN